MKTVRTIENLYQQAMRNSRRESGIGYARTMRRGHPVYEVIIDRNHHIAYLRHYGTITIQYDMRGKELISWYGEGVSDKDSMNTFLSCLSENKYYFRYGPNMGFKIELDSGELIAVEPEAKNVRLPMLIM